MIDYVVSKSNYWIYVVLMMIGFYAMISKKNLIRKLIGLNIFQTAVILFFISTGVKKGATIPIAFHEKGEIIRAIEALQYTNPLPHVLMLTAIVVMISTTGVALSIVIKIYDAYKTIEEDEIPDKEE
ncbi:MAG: cation:proton antiporter subunit C [Thermodesulfobacteriota bacterium]|nr:cation:proton antiporter subunit C [Thermodesulfobacteriota bacterium]